VQCECCPYKRRISGSKRGEGLKSIGKNPYSGLRVFPALTYENIVFVGFYRQLREKPFSEMSH
jgi:hypothetical protein